MLFEVGEGLVGVIIVKMFVALVEPQVEPIILLVSGELTAVLAATLLAKVDHLCHIACFLVSITQFMAHRMCLITMLAMGVFVLGQAMRAGYIKTSYISEQKLL